MEETIIPRCFSLMKSKENTQKFVALAMLPSILSKAPSRALECWKELDFQWIDRLLKSEEPSDNKTQNISLEYKTLALNILTSFASFPELSQDPNMINRIPSLISILPENNLSFISSVLDLLIVLTESHLGAIKILDYQQAKIIYNCMQMSCDALSEKIINLIKHAFIKSLTYVSGIHHFKLSLIKCVKDIANILEQSKGKKRLIILSFFDDIFSNIKKEFYDVLIKDMKVKKILYNILYTLIKEDQSNSTRKITSSLLSSILRLQSVDFILSSASNQEEARTFCVLFTSLASVDIRSILPTIMKKLASKDISDESQRLSTDYEILESMIIYLSNSETIIFQASELLLLQRSFKEAFEESIDFLKDRWENLKKNENSCSKENFSDIFSDLIIVSSVRSLCLWLKEDESLRKYALPIMDIFIYLWKEKNSYNIDYRLWICNGLQGMITTEEGWNNFHDLKFWNIISTDLIKNESEKSDKYFTYIGLSECELLLQAVDKYQKPEENWLNIIKHPKKINKKDNLKAELSIKIIILSLIILKKLGATFLTQHQELLSDHLEISLIWIRFLNSKELDCSWTIPIELKDELLIHLENLRSM
ncbi:uncharacterized protein T551_02898 [Pneumocystis jirovecii RU7]|uniref:Uncharacterized protein n=1 Tax=Pneumocystis jirovecii (strain RU7) TaxID=1408657 RepID=A0A0W4ZHT4_PNEJ7|nr:uncharacterized protein T551_02898 [Pneumocystis jirovecii RU7]KTW27931.1 hypothetical protein T551_02898 [Pneumocystis jirovecii RU7]